MEEDGVELVTVSAIGEAARCRDAWQQPQLLEVARRN
jgi:hypothetical protein